MDALPPARRRRFRTTLETRWHDPGRGWITVPAGSSGELLGTTEIDGLPEDLRREVRALMRRRRRRGERGRIVRLAGRVRWLDVAAFEEVLDDP